MGKVRWDVHPATAAFLVIDMQNDFLLPSSPLAARGGLELLPRVNRMIAAARKHSMLLVFTASTYYSNEPYGRLGDLFPELYHTSVLKDGTPGWQIHPELDYRPGDVLIKKPRYSAFWRTDLDDLLRARGIDTLILSGVWSNCCVESTARDAFFRDYRVIVLEDCVATGDLPDLGHGSFPAEEIQRVTLADLAMHVGQVTSSDELLDLLEQGARVRG